MGKELVFGKVSTRVHCPAGKHLPGMLISKQRAYSSGVLPAGDCA